MRVLVVDDHNEYCHLVAAWLRGLRGIRHIELAASADEALSLMEAATPDLVITDLRMPGMDGLELARKVKAKAPAPVVVVMTSSAPPHFRECAASAGVDYYLEKDSVPDRLMDFLQKRFGLSLPA